MINDNPSISLGMRGDQDKHEEGGRQHHHALHGGPAVVLTTIMTGMVVTMVTLPLVECLLPVVTKSFGQTSQCEWGEEGFRRWGPSSGVASPRGERSRLGPPETQRGPSWAAHALTGRRSRQVPGILQPPAVGSKHKTTSEQHY